MGLRDRLKRIEKQADEHFTIVRCPVCQWEVRYASDLARDMLMREWKELTGREVEPNPVIDDVLKHSHLELANEVVRDIPALRYHPGLPDHVQPMQPYPEAED